MAKNRTKRHGRLCLRVAILLVVAFVFLKGMQMVAQLQEKQEQIDAYSLQIANAQVYNEELEEKNANHEQYLEQQLREKGYARSNDQFYQFSN